MKIKLKELLDIQMAGLLTKIDEEENMSNSQEEDEDEDEFESQIYEDENTDSSNEFD